MIAFHTKVDRLLAWIKAMDILYYDNLGEMSTVRMDWSDDPPQCTESHNTSNSIIIELSSTDEEKVNPLLYKLTFYVSTGTIQVQGNHIDLFIREHFPILKKLVDLVITQCVREDCIEDNEECDQTENDDKVQCQDDELTYVKTVFSSTEATKELPISEHCLGKLKDSISDSSDNQKSELIQTVASKYEESKSVTRSSCPSKESDLISSSHDLGERFDKCIDRMEASFVKAIQGLGKSQNQIFDKAMSSIKDEISTSVIKQIKPAIQEELKSLKADISKGITSSLKDKQKSHDETLLREQIVDLKADHNAEVLKHNAEIIKLKETYHEKMVSQTDKHNAKIQAVSDNHESLQTKNRHELNTVKEQHEVEVKKLKRQLEEYENEIVSLKLHSSRTSDLNEGSPGVQTVGASRRDTGVSSYAMAASSGGPSGGNISSKPFVLLIGTSNIKKIKEDKLSSEVFVVKRTAYTLSETIQTVKDFQGDQTPKTVIFHSFTNDIKTKSPAECLDLFTDIIRDT